MTLAETCFHVQLPRNRIYHLYSKLHWALYSKPTAWQTKLVKSQLKVYIVSQLMIYQPLTILFKSLVCCLLQITYLFSLAFLLADFFVML